MNLTTVINAMDLPDLARLDLRVPKKKLVENGAYTTSDRRKINDSIDEVRWIATLKPNTVGVSEYKDEVREYLEIAVLSVVLRPKAKVGRIVELVHRAIPYPVVLFLVHDKGMSVSLSHKRWSQNEAARTVLEGPMVEVNLESDWTRATEEERLFLKALSLTCQRNSNLFTLYQGWINTLFSLQAARLTGSFVQPATEEQAVSRQHALQECEQLQVQITLLQNSAMKERQMARRVELNLELKRVQTQLAATKEQL